MDEKDLGEVSFAHWAAKFVAFDERTWDPHHEQGLESVRHAAGHLLRSTQGCRGPILKPFDREAVAGITFEAAVRLQRQLPRPSGHFTLSGYMEEIANMVIDWYYKASAEDRSGLWAQYLDVYQSVNDCINEYEDLVARGEVEEARALISLPACSSAVHEYSVYLLRIGVVEARLFASRRTSEHEVNRAGSTVIRDSWVGAIQCRYEYLERKRSQGEASMKSHAGGDTLRSPRFDVV